ncbi:MAG: MFS transporter [Candidatus Thorarchaeota archaeon]
MQSSGQTRRLAYRGIILLGAVSLFGDIVYEGGRGLIPDYLYALGATALVMGLVSGTGEFMGYAVRLVSGELADRTRRYWGLMVLGYSLIVCIPLLAISYSWASAAALVVLERIGKGLRTPSRDSVLSMVSSGVGPGKAFGIHEFLDQIGAIAGPAMVALLMLYSSNNYQLTFAVLFIPFLALVAVLWYTRRSLSPGSLFQPTRGIRDETTDATARLKGPFYVYTLAVALNTVGLIPAALILYRASVLFQTAGQMWMVPVIYVMIQGIDAVIAPFAGSAFDRLGVRTLFVPFAISVLPPLIMWIEPDVTGVVLAAITFGIVLGMQESTYRAAIALYAPLEQRGRAYGMFNTSYGIAALGAGAIFGMFIDTAVSIGTVLIFVLSLQLLAVLLLRKTAGQSRSAQVSE